MLQNSISHRHEDGSVHYTHCHGEYDAAFDPRAQACNPDDRRKRHGKLRVFGISLGLATTAFWAVMLLSPPLTQAQNEPARLAPCLAAAADIAPWFERETRRRAHFTIATFEHGGFKSMLLDYEAAHWQCAAGHVEAAVQSYRALAERVMSLTDHDEPDAR